jgi:hypothetical protein
MKYYNHPQFYFPCSQFQRAFPSATLLLVFFKLFLSIFSLVLPFQFNLLFYVTFFLLSYFFDVFFKIKTLILRFFELFLSPVYFWENVYGLMPFDTLDRDEKYTFNNFCCYSISFVQFLTEKFVQFLVLIRVFILLEPAFFLCFQGVMVHFLIFNMLLSFAYSFSFFISLSYFVFFFTDDTIDDYRKSILRLHYKGDLNNASFALTKSNIILLSGWSLRSLHNDYDTLEGFEKVNLLLSLFNLADIYQTLGYGILPQGPDDLTISYCEKNLFGKAVLSISFLFFLNYNFIIN